MTITECIANIVIGQPYTTPFTVRWSDLDSNGHMANTAYMEYAAQSRLLCFCAGGFPPQRLHEFGVGPVVFRDEMTYLKELRLLDNFTVTYWVSELSEDASRFTVKHDILCPDGQKAAHMISQGAWLNLRQRKLTPPPVEIEAIMRALLIADEK